MPFTDTAIRALKPKATRYSRTDERGLVLEVFPTGGSELVMPGRGSLTKPFAHKAINTALKTALQGQDIPAFTIHDLRRTASTLLHENGWPSDVVEKALNHAIERSQRFSGNVAAVSADRSRRFTPIVVDRGTRE